MKRGIAGARGFNEELILTSSRFGIRQRQTRRNAFTLIETIVSMAIIALVGGMLLSAIQSARASATRVQCLNHMHQLGIGLLHYHDAFRFFPQGTGAAKDAYPFLNWHARILPYVEQSALWQQIEAAFADNNDFRYVPPHMHCRTAVPLFICPTDGRQYNSERETGIAVTNYLGVSGTATERRDGVLFMGSRIRLGEITDGAAETIIVGERPPSLRGEYGWWYAGWGQQKDGALDSVLGVRELNHPYYKADEICGPGPFHFVPDRLKNRCSALHYWSLHPGGAHFIFADGSARFLEYSADKILPGLATRSGGETVQPP